MKILGLWKVVRFGFSALFGEKTRSAVVDAVARSLSTGRKGIDLKHIELPKADLALKLAQATDILVKCLDAVESGVIQAGSLVVVKVTRRGKSCIVAVRVNESLQKKLDQAPGLIRDPETLFSILRSETEDEDQVA